MIQIKKTILTLVALLAVTTGAWAQGVLNIVVDGTSATIKYDGNASNNPYFVGDEWEHGGETWDDEFTTRSTFTTVTIDGSCKNFSGTMLRSLFAYFSGLTTINGLENLNTANVQNMGYMFTGCSSLTSLDLSSWNTENVTTLFAMFESCSSLTTLDLSSWNTAKVWNTVCMFNDCSMLENIYVGDGWSTAAVEVDRDDDMFTGCTKLLSMNTANPATDKTNAHTGDGGYLKVKPAPSSGPEVAWNKAENSGTFTMPGGNVTLEPEYYPQAALAAAPTAINDVPATTDGAIVSAGTVANIGETTTAQGTVMYYVSPTALDDAALLALAADQWTADVPTAADLAQGQAYVYYYVRGNDGDTDDEIFSDGDILAANALTVTLAAEPTYAVTFADGVNPEPPAEPEWTASPAADVKKGQTVTVTYTGTKKVIGVKAEKKASTPSLNITNPVVGQVIGSDGKNYAAANVPSGVDKVAMIAYVSGSNGLAIALADEGSLKWATAISTCEAKTPAFTNGTWKLPSQDEWKQMFGANGGDEGNYDGLITAITTAGGTAFQDGTVTYWSSSEYDSEQAHAMQFYYGNAVWFKDWKVNERYVRACLAF